MVEEVRYYKAESTKNIICVITVRNYGMKKAFRGVAKCFPTDVYDESFGKNVAYEKASLRKQNSYIKELQDVIKLANKSYQEALDQVDMISTARGNMLESLSSLIEQRNKTKSRLINELHVNISK